MAAEVLRSHADGLKELAELLLEREVVFTEDVERIFGKRKRIFCGNGKWPSRRLWRSGKLHPAMRKRQPGKRGCVGRAPKGRRKDFRNRRFRCVGRKIVGGNA